MKIAIGSDHAGFLVKNELIKLIKEKKYDFIDCGTYSQESCDYPDYALKVGKEVVSKNADFGVVICGTGIGISIAANKVKGVRCALVYNKETAILSKMHNNANVIAFGARQFSLEEIKEFFQAYLDTSFEERHQKRIDKICSLEENFLDEK